MTKLVVNGLRYHVTEKGNGVPVLLLHGFTGCGKNWHALMERLSQQYRVITVDLPGHGQTESPIDDSRYTMRNTTADLLMLLDHLEATPAQWLGYSMGGRLALYAALHNPAAVCSLILESASPGLVDDEERNARRNQDEVLAERIENEGIPAFVEYWERLPLFATQAALPTETRASLREQRLQNTVHGLAKSLRGMGTGAQPTLWDRLHQLQMPTLLITGESDEKFIAINRRMATLVPVSRLSIISGAGHTVHLEQPAAFTEKVVQFLHERSEISSNNLSGGKQDNEHERGERHLLEPRVQRRQVSRATDSQAVTDKQGY